MSNEEPPLGTTETPGTTEQRVTAEQTEGRGKEGATEVVSGDTSEVVGQQPMSLGPSTEVPDCPPISIQLPFCPWSFETYRDPSQALAVDSGRFDHLSYD